MNSLFPMYSMAGPINGIFQGIDRRGTEEDSVDPYRDTRRALEEILREQRGRFQMECRREQNLLQGKKATILDSIRAVEQECALLQKLIGKLDIRQRELEREIDQTKRDLSLTENNVEKHRQRLART